VLRDSSSASIGWFLPNLFRKLEKDAPAILRRRRRPWPGVKRRPRAFTALSTSLALAAATFAITSSVEGSKTGNVAPVELETHWPLT